MAARPINALVLGYGFSAKVFHIPFITTTPGIKLHSILQRSTLPQAGGGPSVSAKEDYAGTDVVVFGAWHEVEQYQRDAEEGQKIDLLVITAGNQVHGELVRKGLTLGANGVHVVVEKPFTPTSKECDELVHLAKKLGRILTVYHNRRLDSDFLTLSKLLTPQPTIGAPLSDITQIRSSYNRYVTPTPHRKAWKREVVLGNGVLYDLGAHLIDQALHLFRNNLSALCSNPHGLPTRILGMLHDERGTSLPQSRDPTEWGNSWVDDGFDIFLEYAHPDPAHRNTVVHLTASSASPRTPQERFVVRGIGRAGYVKFGGDTQEAQLLAQVSGPGQEGFGEEPEEEWGELTTTDGKGDWETKKVPAETGNYARYYENVVKAINGQENIAVKPEEAADVIRVIEAVARSWREGRWVEV